MSVVVSKKWLRSSPLNNIYFCIIPRESLHVTALVSVAKLLFAVTPLIPVCRARSTYRTFDHLPDWRFNLPGAKMKRPISFWAEWRKSVCRDTHISGIAPRNDFPVFLPNRCILSLCAILVLARDVQSTMSILHFSRFAYCHYVQSWEIKKTPRGGELWVLVDLLLFIFKFLLQLLNIFLTFFR